MLKVFNDLANRLEEFKPLHAPDVRMYVCGPTVYDVPHLGHARSEVAFDMIRKYLEFKGFKVKYVHNYTDVDDKMINRANEEGTTIGALASRIIETYEAMQKALQVATPSVKPRATEEIPEIIDLIQVLEKKDYTYGNNGSVYFDTAKMPDYKSLFLKKKLTEDAQPDEFTQSTFLDEKRNREDFVLWKKKKDGEPFWPSPWGEGRPGWHIECSAMSMKYLGDSIDIHGGGKDLKRPHHQNEIAQSEAATGQPFAKYWLHNGFLNIDNTKMSKSLGNFIPLEDLLTKYSGKIIRFYFLSSYYIKPINFLPNRLEEAKVTLARIHTFYNTVQSYEQLKPKGDDDGLLSDQIEALTKYSDLFFNAMDKDFNTSMALGRLFSLINYFSKQVFNKQLPLETGVQTQIINFLDDLDSFLNVIKPDPEGEVQNPGDSKWKDLLSAVVGNILEYRKELKKEKNYNAADALRDVLKKSGISVDDNGNEYTWSSD